MKTILTILTMFLCVNTYAQRDINNIYAQDDYGRCVYEDEVFNMYLKIDGQFIPLAGFKDLKWNQKCYDIMEEYNKLYEKQLENRHDLTFAQQMDLAYRRAESDTKAFIVHADLSTIFDIHPKLRQIPTDGRTYEAIYIWVGEGECLTIY